MTTQPTTLRTIAGLPTDPPLLADSTLVVIDAQQAYGPVGPLALEGIEAAADSLASLIERARDLGTPVVHVAHIGGPGSPFDPLDGGRFLDQAMPLDGETIVEKRLPNSFAGTDLLERLAANPQARVRPLVVAGFMTHMCVSSTTRAALDLGIDTAVASDATATRSLPSSDGTGAIPASIVQQAALAALADRFSIITTTGALRENRHRR